MARAGAGAGRGAAGSRSGSTPEAGFLSAASGPRDTPPTAHDASPGSRERLVNARGRQRLGAQRAKVGLRAFSACLAHCAASEVALEFWVHVKVGLSPDREFYGRRPGFTHFHLAGRPLIWFFQAVQLVSDVSQRLWRAPALGSKNKKISLIESQLRLGPRLGRSGGKRTLLTQANSRVKFTLQRS